MRFEGGGNPNAIFTFTCTKITSLYFTDTVLSCDNYHSQTDRKHNYGVCKGSCHCPHAFFVRHASTHMPARVTFLNMNYEQYTTFNDPPKPCQLSRFFRDCTAMFESPDLGILATAVHVRHGYLLLPLCTIAVDTESQLQCCQRPPRSRGPYICRLRISFAITFVLHSSRMPCCPRGFLSSQ